MRTLLLFAALVLTGCCELARGVVFPAPANEREPTFGERIEVGDCVASWVRAEGERPTIVHFHGNGQQIADLAHLAEVFETRGIGFVAVEYPGYGGADGSPSEETIDACADRVLRHVAREVPRSRIVLEGQSIGTGPAVEMAKRGLGSRLVLVSPYTSMPDLFRTLGAPESLACDRFDNAAKAPAITMPVLIVHGTADTLIPASMGETLAKRFPHARLALVKNGGHNDLFARHGDEVIGEIVGFVE